MASARRSLLLAGGIFFGLVFLASLFVAYTTGRYEAVLYGVFPLALSVVMIAMARKAVPA
ncbi:MAG TPA: hypothetical protein VM327_10600 [Candidatus Thermoplasmatota archaeon]|nr:hypothetical protein [Candidatus Thermoplasmatota archaeon]